VEEEEEKISLVKAHVTMTFSDYFLASFSANKPVM